MAEVIQAKNCIKETKVLISVKFCDDWMLSREFSGDICFHPLFELFSIITFA